MTDHYVLYQDIADFSPQVFMKLDYSQPGAKMVDEKIIPGWGENPPIYVRWHHQQFGPNTLHLLTYTYTELRDLQVRAILLKAARFAWGNTKDLDR